MSAPLCPRLPELLAGRDADRLAPSDEALLRRHLAECGECAARALRHDPVLLFARDAAPEPLSVEARERFVGDVLASVSGSFNAVLVNGDTVGETLFYGRGAGQDPTSSSVISDLCEAAAVVPPPPGPPGQAA